MDVSGSSVAGTRCVDETARAVDDPGTIGRAFAAAMRHHARAAAIQEREEERWSGTPDWRLDRQVIRLGLFLRERVRVTPGDRVVIVSPLRREMFLAEWATVLQGAVSVVLDPSVGAELVANVVSAVGPRALFLEDGEVLEDVVEGARPTSGDARVIAIDPLSSVDGHEPGVGRRIPPLDQVMRFSEVMDLGGTLDTPERAGSFRSAARELAPDTVALCDFTAAKDGRPSLRKLTHADVVARLGRVWSADRARPGDLAYVAGGAPDLPARLAVLAFVCDGTTTTTLGTPGLEVQQVAALQPQHVVAPPAIIEAIATDRASRGGKLLDMRALLERAGLLGRLALRAQQRQEGPRRLRRFRATRPIAPARTVLSRGSVPVEVDAW